MDTLFDFTADDLDVNNTMLSHGYRVVDAGEYFDRSDPLYGVYQSVMFQCELLLDGYEGFSELGIGDIFLEGVKIYWLLCHTPFTHFPSQFKSFIIERFDSSLNELDYVLLFYISLQSEGIQNTTQGLPLPMLYDMFMPVADANFEEWKLVS
jgi:hypothetical protein